MAASSSSNQSDFEEVPESYYKKMDELFGPLNNPVPKKRSDDKKEVAGEKRKMSVEEKLGGAKQKKGAAAGGIEATEKEGVPVVQRSLETANIVSPAETLAPTPTPEATVPLVPRLSVDSVLQQSFSNGCAIRREPSGPVHQVVNNYGPVTIYMGECRKPEEQQNMTAEPQVFTIVNIRIQSHQVSVIEAIVSLLGQFDIQLTPADVKLVGAVHGMPKTNCKRFNSDFQLTVERTAAVLDTLSRRPITAADNEETIQISKKVSYIEILEQELLKLGLKLFSERLAPSVVRIEGKSVVYNAADIPTKTVALSINDMLDDEVFLTKVRNTFNRVARMTIRDRIQK